VVIEGDGRADKRMIVGQVPCKDGNLSLRSAVLDHVLEHSTVEMIESSSDPFVGECAEKCELNGPRMSPHVKDQQLLGNTFFGDTVLETNARPAEVCAIFRVGDAKSIGHQYRSMPGFSNGKCDFRQILAQRWLPACQSNASSLWKAAENANGGN